MTGHTALLRSEAGFTLMELLIATAMTLIIMGGALTAFRHAGTLNETSSLILEMNDSLRTASDLMVRDFIQVGQGLPSGKVIEKPNGGTATAVRRPGPAASLLTFPVADANFAAVTTGAGLGPAYTEPTAAGGTLTGPATDIVTVIYADSQFDGLPCTIASNNLTVTVASPPTVGAALISGAGVLDPMLPGDLIMITGSTAASGSTLMQVTAVNLQVITMAVNDTMNLNQRIATAVGDGTIVQLLPAVPAATSAALSRIRMITFFVDNSVEPPRLMRQLNYNTARTVAFGIDNVQLTYDIADGGTNPTNVKSPANPNQIRKVNLYLSARSRVRNSLTKQFMRNTLATQVALRSLAFVDRYR